MCGRGEGSAGGEGAAGSHSWARLCHAPEGGEGAALALEGAVGLRNSMCLKLLQF